MKTKKTDTKHGQLESITNPILREKKMPREKTVKLSAEKYDALSELLGGQRNRAQALEGLIAVLLEAAHENKYVVYDILSDPSALEIGYKKKTKKK